jgi:hypothetical protein
LPELTHSILCLPATSTPIEAPHASQNLPSHNNVRISRRMSPHSSGVKIYMILAVVEHEFACHHLPKLCLSQSSYTISHYLHLILPIYPKRSCELHPHLSPAAAVLAATLSSKSLKVERPTQLLNLVHRRQNTGFNEYIYTAYRNILRTLSPLLHQRIVLILAHEDCENSQ